ncbi:MAG: hypothetical protein LBV12_01580 [Puniceicoccales bacterium]|jgi:hypothetical protein|nr:hypothetical protein [Puniceicoccales bacterium]
MSSCFILKNKEGQETGPLSIDTVRAWMKDKQCNFFTPARRMEDESWKMVGSFVEFSRTKMDEAENPPEISPISITTEVIVDISDKQAPIPAPQPVPSVSTDPKPRVGQAQLPSQTRSPFLAQSATSASPLRASSPPPPEVPQYTYSSPANNSISDEDEFELATWVKVVWLVIMGGFLLFDLVATFLTGDFVGMGRVVFSIFWRCLIFYGIPKGIAWIVWRCSGRYNRFVPAAFLTSFIGLLILSVFIAIFVKVDSDQEFMQELQREIEKQEHLENASGVRFFYGVGS